MSAVEKLTIGCVAPPGGSLVNKTGAWRSNRPLFKHKACIACQACVQVCPEGSVFANLTEKHLCEKLKKEVANFDVDLDYCKGCGMCATECPVDDIDMAPEVR